MPTFGDWFNGRFWREWVIAQKNKPTEVRSKQIIYRLYLEPRFKDTPLDKIDVSAIAQLRADLVDAELSEKRSNNILAVLLPAQSVLQARRARSGRAGSAICGRRPGLSKAQQHAGEVDRRPARSDLARDPLSAVFVHWCPSQRA